MPGKGSPKVTFRCPPELLSWLEGRVEWSKTDRKSGELDMSGLILLLIREGRKKRERSRTWRRKKRERQQQRETGA